MRDTFSGANLSSSTPESLADRARELALSGFRVFPLKPDGRTPLITDFAHKAGNKNFWKKYPKANIGISTGYDPIQNQYLTVIDVDMKNGKNGIESLKDLQAFHGTIPDTFTVKTPSGGFHIYFYASKPVKNSVEKLGAGLDVRGANGYVVGPHSLINGSPYVIFANVPIATLPRWLEDLLERHNPREKDLSPAAPYDLPHNVQKALEWLLTDAPDAIQGASGDQVTFTVAATLKDYGLSPEKSLSLLLEYWNEFKAFPPWPPHGLKQKVDNAFRYGTNQPGSATPEAAFDEPDLSQPLTTGDHSSPFSIPPLLPLSPESLPPRQWLLYPLFIRGKVTLLIAPPGAGKSTLTLALGLSLASGKPFLNFKTSHPTPVAVVNNEDDFTELQRRSLAIMQHHALSFADLQTRHTHRPTFFLQSGEDKPFLIAKKTNNIVSPANLEPIVSFLKANNIKLFIVDPFAETHNANENDNVEMLLVASFYRRIAQQADCAVCIVHHTRKPSNASTASYAGDMNTGRGASAVLGLGRVVVTLYAMAAKDAKAYSIPEDQKHLYVRLDDAKANLSLVSSQPRWFKRVSVHLPTSDPGAPESIGSLEPVHLTSVIEQDMLNAKALIDDIRAVLADGQRRSLRQFWIDLAAYNEMLFLQEDRRPMQERIKRIIARELAAEYRIEKNLQSEDRRISYSIIPLKNQ